MVRYTLRRQMQRISSTCLLLKSCPLIHAHCKHPLPASSGEVGQAGLCGRLRSARGRNSSAFAAEGGDSSAPPPPKAVALFVRPANGVRSADPFTDSSQGSCSAPRSKRSNSFAPNKWEPMKLNHTTLQCVAPGNRTTPFFPWYSGGGRFSPFFLATSDCPGL
jgi:hypothetical protein